MAIPSVTYTFTNSTVADATEVNTNFNNIISSLTDGTSDHSISTLTLAGALTANGNVTLGNASGDTMTVNATPTFNAAVTIGGVDFTVDTDTLFVDASEDNVGIGTTSPQVDLHVVRSSLSGASYRPNAPFAIESSGQTELQILSGSTSSGQIRFGDGDSDFGGSILYSHSGDQFEFFTNGSSTAKMAIYASDGMEFKPSTNSIKRFTGGVYPGTTAARNILTVATDNTSGFVRIKFTSSRNVSSAQGSKSHEILTYWYSTSKGTVVTQTDISSGTNAGDPTVAWSSNTLTLAQSSANGGGAYIMDIEVAWNGGTAPTFDI